MTSGIRWFAAVVALVASACASSPKPEPAKATATAAPPRGGKEALAVIREIQAEPLRDDDGAKAKNAVVLMWLTKSPDITVVLCGDLLPIRDPAGPDDSKLFIQVMFGQAAYQLEHPGVAPKDEAVYTAGLVGGLRAYRMLRTSHPEQRNPAWDELDAAERKGALSPHVRKAMESCSKG